MKLISKKMVRKVLELMKNIAKEEKGEDKDDDDDEEKEKKEDNKEKSKVYLEFFNEYGKNLKLGCQEDDANRSKLFKLLRFKSTKSDGELMSLDQYLDRMQEN